jgi:acyl-CoA reductase-like NAD-dependent aldehyde dehydrogenase
MFPWIQLSQQAGAPAGVFNVGTGSRQSATAIGDALSSNELVTAVSFTGSTGVGKLLMRQCADTVKKVSLELGGNAPLIVFNSADVQNAVQGTISTCIHAQYSRANIAPPPQCLHQYTFSNRINFDD